MKVTGHAIARSRNWEDERVFECASAVGYESRAASKQVLEVRGRFSRLVAQGSFLKMFVRFRLDRVRK